jgi:hypothetical protein
MDVIFFHGLQFAVDGSTDAWRSTWTQKGCDDVCWAKEWLPFDLGENVRILSVAYDARVIASPHDCVSEIAHNVFETLIKRCDSLLVCQIVTPDQMSLTNIYQANNFSHL